MTGRLAFIAPGACAADQARGLAAAELFLKRSGVSAEHAAAGVAAQESWGDSGLAPLHEPTPAEAAAAQALDGALEAALLACYRGRAAPLDAELRLAAV